jgi:spore maturation protein SpmA
MKPKTSAINIIFIILVLGSIFVALFTSKMADVTGASFNAAKTAVNLAISLIGAMALWLGLMKIAEEAGLLTVIARALKPVMIRLFPSIPGEHPAMSAMIMNLAANVMGLGNAATPFGIKAMQELDKLNPTKGDATNAMCLFLAINTSAVTLLPLGVIAVRAGAGASQPGSILVPAILATMISTAVAITAAKLFERRHRNHDVIDPGKVESNDESEPEQETVLKEPLQAEGWRKVLLPGYLFVFIGAFVYQIIQTISVSGDIDALLNDIATSWLIPFLMGILVVYGLSRNVDVYGTVCEGAKEGFQVAIKIIPFLVAILVAIGMFRASGALDFLISIVSPVTSLIGMPPDTLPMALVRPLSGSGAFGVMSDIVARDPDSLSAFIASIMQGSTETTFYVMAIYFGSVGVFRVRYAIAAALMADCAGIIAAVLLGNLFY